MDSLKCSYALDFKIIHMFCINKFHITQIVSKTKHLMVFQMGTKFPEYQSLPALALLRENANDEVLMSETAVVLVLHLSAVGADALVPLYPAADGGPPESPCRK